VAQRILRGAPATLTFHHLDSNGQIVAATGTITVGVVRGDGTTVLSAGTATTTDDDGTYTVPLTAAQTSSLDLLTATWSDSASPGVTRTTYHEVVGGFLFTINDAMTEQGVDAYDKAEIIKRRGEVEDECEWICDIAWVPRYKRLVLDGTGEDLLVTGVRAIRSVRSVRTYSTTGGTSFVQMTPAQLAGLSFNPDGAIRRTDGDVWVYGFGNIVIEIEHGENQPPDDLRTAAVIRCQDAITRPDSALPTRAQAYNDSSGASYDLVIPDKFSTGIPTVDAVYRRHSKRESATPDGGPGGGGSAGPASRTLSYDPQFYGLFRGGRR
jgi:hypothetical protein